MFYKFFDAFIWLMPFTFVTSVQLSKTFRERLRFNFCYKTSIHIILLLKPKLHKKLYKACMYGQKFEELIAKSRLDCIYKVFRNSFKYNAIIQHLQNNSKWFYNIFINFLFFLLKIFCLLVYFKTKKLFNKGLITGKEWLKL